MAQKPWKRTVGSLCYVFAGLCIFAAVALPIITLIFFVFWVSIVGSAAVSTVNQDAFGLVLNHTAHDPLGGTLILITALVAGVASAIGIMVVILVAVEIVLVIAAIVFIVIGRRLRRA